MYDQFILMAETIIFDLRKIFCLNCKKNRQNVPCRERKKMHSEGKLIAFFQCGAAVICIMFLWYLLPHHQRNNCENTFLDLAQPVHFCCVKYASDFNIL